MIERTTVTPPTPGVPPAPRRAGSIVPPARPKIDAATAVKILARHGISTSAAPALLGIRGYYKRTMGDPTQNDRAIYDDAIALVGPTFFATYNANCDPGKYERGIANLACGVWSYRLGIHGLSRAKELQYEALVQAAPVTVIRDGGTVETGMFAINIHRGSYGKTGSLGCQTIHPDQWPGFIGDVKRELQVHDAPRIPYVLIEEP